MPDFTGELGDATDETIRAALVHADIPALLAALASATGDTALVPDHLRPHPSGMLDTTAGLGPDEQDEARGLAFDALVRLRDRRPDPGEVPVPSPDVVRACLAFIAADEDIDDYLELLDDELNIGADPRRPTWTVDEMAPGRTFRAAVIGAGMSGLLAAHRLRQAGVDVVVFEKNPDVGGTWFENSYPGCRVDVSNLFYSYSFAQRADWPEHFSSQPVLLDYFRRFAADTGVRDLVRFDTEVTSVELDEDTATWTVRTAHSGVEDSVEVDAVVSAVGQLNRPNMPDIPGLDRFEGPAFHSARWDHSVDIDGKRVAVIGTGASAAQFIPHVAARAGHLDVFQRTPAWFIPMAEYTQPIGAEVRWLRRNVPGYTHWSRFWVFWRNVEGLMPMATVDPEWDGGERSVGPANEAIRQLLTAYLEDQFADRPDLLPHVVPDYPPFSKRFILDDGAWARALKSPDTELVTTPIAEVTATGVRTTDGVDHEADVLVYGTGFAASDFLTPMAVVGRGGRELHDVWAGDARAHLGITFPGFPNLFMLYGPNTNIVVNGSITFFSECEVHYILGWVRSLLETGAAAFDTRPEAHDAYNRRIDEANARMAWGASSVSSWYKNSRGRVSQNWPFSLLAYWQQTREPDPADLEVVEPVAGATPAGPAASRSAG